MPKNQPLGYVCRNTGAHPKNVVCTDSCIPYYSEEQHDRLLIKR